jgi:hypothetical protein
MRNVTWICALGLGGLALAACGSSSSGNTGGAGGTSSSTTSSTTSTTSSTTASTTSSTTSGTGGSATTGTGGSGPACSGVELTVLNYLSWCSVSVAGGATSAAGSQTVCVPDGAVTLSATALSGFQLGDWYGVTGDTGSGTPGTVSNGTSTAMVTASGTTQCVSICCPNTGTTDCPGSNQCPP